MGYRSRSVGLPTLSPVSSDPTKDFRDTRLERAELLENHLREPNKHAGIPVVVTSGEIFLRGLDAGLFFELLDPVKLK